MFDFRRESMSPLGILHSLCVVLWEEFKEKIGFGRKVCK